jgi:hypothetical protein
MKVLGFPAPPIAFAALDARGPAEMVLIRIPYLRPNSKDSVFVSLSRAAYNGI